MAHLGRVRETQNHKIILIKNYRKIALVAGYSKEKKIQCSRKLGRAVLQGVCARILAFLLCPW